MLEFVEDWNRYRHEYPQDTIAIGSLHDHAKYASELVFKSFQRQFIKEEKRSRLSISSLGYHPFEIAGKYFYPERKELMSEKVKLTLSMGDYFEAYALFMFIRLGYTVREYNPDIKWYAGVGGHPDFIIEDPDGFNYIVDTKAVNNRYFNSVKNYGLDDERGYLTQIACYSDALTVPSCLLMMNKDTSELMTVFPSQKQTEMAVSRAKYIVDCIQKCESFEDAFKYFVPPAPLPESVKNEETGKREFTGFYKVPFEFMFSPYKDLIYILDENGYVLDYRYPSQYKHLKPEV